MAVLLASWQGSKDDRQASKMTGWQDYWQDWQDDKQASKMIGWQDYWQVGRTGRMTGRLAR